MSVWQQIRFVIVPHIAKTIYPALANFFIVILVMGTSIGAVIGVDELTGHGDQHLDRELPLDRDVHRRRRHLCRADARRQHVARRWSAAGPSASRRRCSDAGAAGRRNPALLQRRTTSYCCCEAMGTTLALTVIGCVLGFLLAFVHRVPAADAGRLAAADAARGDRSMSRSSGAFPFLVVTYLVLFFIQAFVSNASLFAIAVDRHLHLLDRLYGRHHPRRLRIGGAPADRGGGGHELQPLADAASRDHAAVLAGHPAAGGRPSWWASSRTPRWSRRSACSS